MIKVTNISATSREAYKQAIVTDVISSQQQQAFECIQSNGPLTRRQLSVITGIEISALCRGIANLIQEHKVRVAFEQPCLITGKRAKHYVAVPEMGKPLIQLRIL